MIVGGLVNHDVNPQTIMYDVGAIVAHLPVRMQGEFSKPCRGPGGFDNPQTFYPGGIAARNGFIIPTRDLGARRAPLRRYGNRRNVELEP